MGNKGNKSNRDLNEKEIHMLVDNTGLTQQEVLKWHNQFLSEFPDGFIDKVFTDATFLALTNSN
jgi:hypothetical protein